MALPRRQKTPNRRLQELVRKMRRETEVVECEEVFDVAVKCCGKETFPTEEQATLRLHEIQRDKHMRSNKPHRVYQCPEGRWHLTSRGKNERRKKFWG
jgi:hypothetical protein